MSTSLRSTRRRLLAEEKRLPHGKPSTFADEKDNVIAYARKTMTQDSFQNFMAMMGIGTDNLSSSSTYGFNPITRNRVLLEWIHRGSWVGGMAVDVVSDDMTRMGVDLTAGEIEADEAQALQEAAVGLQLWPQVNDTIRGARLYGGAILVPLLDGQNMETPLRIETIGRGQLKGFLALDRYQINPSLENLVSKMSPDYGLPTFYTVTGEAPGLRQQRIHHSRVMRLEGVRLPYWQRVIENLWGISVLERLYDRMVAFDSATTGAAQLIYKCWTRQLKVKKLREIVATGGPQLAGLHKYVDMMRRFQSIEGLTLIDGDDDYGTSEVGAFSGIAEALVQFGQQLSGALQIPLVRLFGQSPAGLNSTGESDLKMYYDGILQQQERWLRIPITRMYRMIARSDGIVINEGFRLEFVPLWQLTEEQKSAIAANDMTNVNTALQVGVSLPSALRELKKLGKKSGRWDTLPEEEIEAAEQQMAAAPSAADLLPGSETGLPKTDEARKALQDDAHGLRSTLGMAYYHQLPVVIESVKGSQRHPGVDLPADYGYVRATRGADGDQVDCYVGPFHASDRVFIVNQLDPDTGAFDEHKVVLGVWSPESAEELYRAGHDRSSQAFGGMKEMSMDEFKRWLAAGSFDKAVS